MSRNVSVCVCVCQTTDSYSMREFMQTSYWKSATGSYFTREFGGGGEPSASIQTIEHYNNKMEMQHFKETPLSIRTSHYLYYVCVCVSKVHLIVPFPRLQIWFFVCFISLSLSLSFTFYLHCAYLFIYFFSTSYYFAETQCEEKKEKQIWIEK